MSKNESASSNNLAPVITAIIGVIGTIAVAYFTFRSNVAPKELEISATQTAESFKATQTAAVLFAVPTDTPSITASEASLTPSPTTSSAYLFEDGCINKGVWSLLEGNTAPENNNCWNLENKGIFALQETGLSINVINPPSSRVNGLVTGISSDTDISFKMEISELATISDWNTNIAIGLLPSATSIPSQDGTSILFQSGVQDKPIWMMLQMPDIKQIYLPPPRISINQVYNVKLEIRGTRLITYLEYEIVDDRSLPKAHPFLWVGYTVAQGATLSVTLTDFSLISR
ncbi:MAG: hypothetical protein IPM31_13855 [Anaerolineae bacterium]|nr:hypothetical protein [Anaerolineae bacterium]MBL8107413.1 hypothetical protein [Anaerolineales bacterium]